MIRRLAPIVVGAFVLAGCGHGAAARPVALPDGGHADGGALVTAVASLCGATTEAGHSPAMAGSDFYLRSHTELHTLAAALGLVDRVRSARVLQAMYTVEQDIAASPTRPALAPDLAALTDEAGGGLVALHLPTPSCTRSHP